MRRMGVVKLGSSSVSHSHLLSRLSFWALRLDLITTLGLGNGLVLTELKSSFDPTVLSYWFPTFTTERLKKGLIPFHIPIPYMPRKGKLVIWTLSPGEMACVHDGGGDGWWSYRGECRVHINSKEFIIENPRTYVL